VRKGLAARSGVNKVLSARDHACRLKAMNALIRYANVSRPGKQSGEVIPRWLPATCIYTERHRTLGARLSRRDVSNNSSRNRERERERGGGKGAARAKTRRLSDRTREKSRRIGDSSWRFITLRLVRGGESAASDGELCIVMTRRNPGNVI